MNDIPAGFGSSPEMFHSDWCLNVPAPFTDQEATRSLDALTRLHPQYIRSILEGPTKGLLVISPAIDFGLVIADCEHLSGFEPVMDRVRNGEHGAKSELTLAAMMVRLNYLPIFGAPLKGKVLDLLISIDDRDIYFEVVAPHHSDTTTEAQRLSSQLTQTLQSQNSSCRVEVGLLTDLTDKVCEQVIQLVAKVPDNSNWYESPEIAVVRKTPKGTQLKPMFDGASAAVIVGGETDIQGDSSSVTIRWPSSDHRLKRIFNDEHDHFSQDVCNILAINTSAIPSAIADWVPLISRLFQPKQNRRVSAVVLFASGTIVTDFAVRRVWRVISNPFANLQAPKEFLDKIRSLDESRFWRGQN